MHKVISFHYKLTNKTGETLDSSAGGEPLTFLSGSGQIISGLETELMPLAVGEKKKIQVDAAKAYGVVDPTKVFEVPLDRMPTQTIKVGDKFRTGKGNNDPIVTVTKVTEKQVILDANHPLAGIDLTFDVEITANREATKEEIEHGHVHGGGGHHH